MLKRNIPQILLPLLILLAGATHAAAQDDLPRLIRHVKPSVVGIITYDFKGDALTTGSGFFVRPGQVLTNLHVIEGARRVEVRTLDGKGKTYAVAGIDGLDEEGDLALLRVEIPSEHSRPVELKSELPEEGEKIFVIGNPLRLEGSVSDGIVSAVREIPNLGNVIQITAPISHGNSGSPLFNMKGKVLGVVSMKVTNGQNINLAIASARIDSIQPEKRPLTFEELSARDHKKLGENALSEWWYRNGLTSLWLGNYDSALGYFERAVDKNPSRAEGWIQVGFCRLKQGNNKEAIRAYKQALHLRPNSYEAYNKLGDAYYYSGEFDEAIQCYKRAVSIKPDGAEGYYNLGMAYVEIGDRPQALLQCRALEELNEPLHEKLLSELDK